MGGFLVVIRLDLELFEPPFVGLVRAQAGGAGGDEAEARPLFFGAGRRQARVAQGGQGQAQGAALGRGP